MDAYIAACEAEEDRQERYYNEVMCDLEALQRFASLILENWPDYTDIDMGDVQSAAEATGLIKSVEVSEPCGEGCGCAEFGPFPITCYKYTGVIRRALACPPLSGEGEDE